MGGFFCAAFLENILAGKTLLDYNEKNHISILNIKMIKEASLPFRLTQIDEIRNYLLDEIKHNDLISEKYKKTCKAAVN